MLRQAGMEGSQGYSTDSFPIISSTAKAAEWRTGFARTSGIRRHTFKPRDGFFSIIYAISANLWAGEKGPSLILIP